MTFIHSVRGVDARHVIAGDRMKHRNRTVTVATNEVIGDTLWDTGTFGGKRDSWRLISFTDGSETLTQGFIEKL